MFKKLLLMIPYVRKMHEELLEAGRQALEIHLLNDEIVEIRKDAKRLDTEAKESIERLNERVRQLSDAVLKERDETSKRQVEITRLKASVAHEQRCVEAKSRVIAELRASRALVWLRPAVPLNREQLREAFEVDETDLLWRSVNQVLDDAIGDALDEVTQRKLSPEDRAHAAGGAEALRQFQKALLDWYSLAHRDDAEDSSEDAA